MVIKFDKQIGIKLCLRLSHFTPPLPPHAIIHNPAEAIAPSGFGLPVDGLMQSRTPELVLSELVRERRSWLITPTVCLCVCVAQSMEILHPCERLCSLFPRNNPATRRIMHLPHTR